MRYGVGSRVLRDWTLVRLIGQGAFGQVYEARREDREFGHSYTAAIKIITIPQNQSEVQSIRDDGMDEQSVTAYFHDFVRELTDEFDLMSKLKGNSNVVSCEDYQVIPHEEGIGWDLIIRMELLTPLNRHVQDSAVSQRDVIRLGIDMCKALELCQRFNIIHRDIKPENILVSETGEYKLGDFGIARTAERSTSGMSRKGTDSYMAPEVYKEEPYNSTVDIYSLGIVLYRLLNNSRTPFLPDYPNPITVRDRDTAMAKRMSGAVVPPPCNAEGPMADIVLKACAYRAEDRYATPTQMRHELEALMYRRDQTPYLYSQGDTVPQKTAQEETPPAVDTVGEAKTSALFETTAGQPASADEGTVGLFTPQAQPSFEEAPEEEKTASIFGGQSQPSQSSLEAAPEEKTASIFDSKPSQPEPAPEKPQQPPRRPEPAPAPAESSKSGSGKGKLVMIAGAAVLLVGAAAILLPGKDSTPVPPAPPAPPASSSSSSSPSSSSSSSASSSSVPSESSPVNEWYDDLGRLYKVEHYTLDSHQKTERYLYVYKDYDDPDSPYSISHDIYEFLPSGETRLEKVEHLNEHFDLQTYDVYVYNDDGSLKEIVYYNADGTPQTQF